MSNCGTESGENVKENKMDEVEQEETRKALEALEDEEVAAFLARVGGRVQEGELPFRVVLIQG